MLRSSEGAFLVSDRSQAISVLELCAAVLANSDLLAILNLVSDSCKLVALGANELNLGRIERTLSLNSAAELTGLLGLNVLCYHVNAFDDNLVLLSGNGNDLTLLALICAADNLNLITGFNI